MTNAAYPQTHEPAPRGLADYLYALRRRWYLVALGPVIAVTVALVTAQMATPLYSARAEMLAQPAAGINLYTGSQGGGQGGQQTSLATQLQLMRSSAVRAQVAERLGIQPGQVPGVAPEQIGTTQVVAVKVTDPDPQLAAAAADAYVEVFIENRQAAAIDSLTEVSSELQSRIDAAQVRIDEIDEELRIAADERRPAPPGIEEERDRLVSQQIGYREQIERIQVDAALQDGGGELVTPAWAPSDPVSPTPVRDAGVAFIAGLVVGVALALLVDHLDDSLRDDDDLRRVSGDLPVLATVPVTRTEDRRPVVIDLPASPAAEGFRTLRTSVLFMGVDRPMRVIQITSAVPGEGKTTTASNLAVVMARAGQRVAIVDCDLRRARQHEVFGLPLEPGLTSVVMGAARLDECVHKVPGEDRLYVLPAGPPPPNPSELLSSPTVSQVLEALIAPNTFDVVIVDAPPVLPFTDATVLASRVDGTIVVAAAGQSRRKHVRRVLDTLGLVSAPVVGFVFNKARPTPGMGAYGYGYGYGRKGDKRRGDTPAAAPATAATASTGGGSAGATHDVASDDGFAAAVTDAPGNGSGRTKRSGKAGRASSPR